MKDERFALVLTKEEKKALQLLAEHERLSAAAVVRRLIWDAASAGQPAATGKKGVVYAA